MDFRNLRAKRRTSSFIFLTKMLQCSRSNEEIDMILQVLTSMLKSLTTNSSNVEVHYLNNIEGCDDIYRENLVESYSTLFIFCTTLLQDAINKNNEYLITSLLKALSIDFQLCDQDTLFNSKIIQSILEVLHKEKSPATRNICQSYFQLLVSRTIYFTDSKGIFY